MVSEKKSACGGKWLTSGGKWPIVGGNGRQPYYRMKIDFQFVLKLQIRSYEEVYTLISHYVIKQLNMQVK